MKRVLMVFGVFLIAFLVFCVVYAFFLFNTDISSDVHSVERVCFIASVVLYLILGVLAGLVHKKRGLIFGVSYAFCMMLIFFLIGFLGYSIVIDNWIKVVSCLLASGAGGMIGVNAKRCQD